MNIGDPNETARLGEGFREMEYIERASFIEIYGLNIA